MPGSKVIASAEHHAAVCIEVNAHDRGIAAN